jgi:hypothetical protein
MPKGVNVFYSDWRALGTNAQCPRYSMTIRFEWTGNDDQPRSTGDTVITFPNVLSQLTPAELSYFGDELQELIMRLARRRAGVDNS